MWQESVINTSSMCGFWSVNSMVISIYGLWNYHTIHINHQTRNLKAHYISVYLHLYKYLSIFTLVKKLKEHLKTSDLNCKKKKNNNKIFWISILIRTGSCVMKERKLQRAEVKDTEYQSGKTMQASPLYWNLLAVTQICLALTCLYTCLITL